MSRVCTATCPSGFENREAGIGWTFFLLALAAGAVIAMGASYLAVRLFLEDKPVPAASSAGYSEALELRLISNEMLRSTQDYLARATAVSPVPSTRFQRWVSETYAPGMIDLRRRILSSRYSSDALNTLLATSDRLIAMASRPNDVALRRLAANDVLDGVAAGERRIELLGYKRSLRPLPLVPGFRKIP